MCAFVSSGGTALKTESFHNANFVVDGQTALKSKSGSALASRVHSVAATVLVGSISYLYILSSNFSRCVACKISCKIRIFGKFSKFVTLSFFDLGTDVNHWYAGGGGWRGMGGGRGWGGGWGGGWVYIVVIVTLTLTHYLNWCCLVVS